MSELDLEQILAPVDGENPCGRDLFEDPRFYQMTQAMKGEPERTMGDSIIPAVPPDFSSARSLCLELLRESKDVRLGVELASIELGLRGHPGFADGLTLIHGMLDRYWEHVFPALDNGDAFDRAIAIEAFNTPEFALRVRKAPVFEPSGGYPLSQRDCAIASGHERATAAEESEGLPGPGDVSQAAAGTPIEVLRANATSVDRSIEMLKSIGALLSERGGESARIKMDKLEQALPLCAKPARQALEDRGETGDAGGASSADESSDASSASVAVGGEAGGPAPQGLPGAVHSRQEAKKAIDLAIRFFEKHEPSHPAPILLNRARDLMDKPFLDVIGELMPESELKNLRDRLGLRPQDEAGG